jgi:murein DD-endopeptidase MepM/ murein hydrolase activator NlpD
MLKVRKRTGKTKYRRADKMPGMNRSGFIVLLFAIFLSGCVSDPQRPAPVTTYGGGLGAGTLGVHTVTAGETLWKIAERYRMGVQDIARLNKLQAPFYLHDGQRLALPPPQEYRVREGDSIYQLSRMFGTSQTELARLNNLKAPYSLIPGHKLRLPSPAPKYVEPPKPRAVYEESRTAEREYKPSSIYDAYQKPQGAKPTPQQQHQQQQHQQQQAQAWIPSEPAYEPPQEKKQRVTAQTPARSSSKFMRPVSGSVISGYGPKADGLHNDGINIRAPKDAPVRAGDNGVVVYAGNELKGSGNLVLIRHADRWMTAYAHLGRMLVKRGETVKRGQSIGTVGSSGSVSEPQLHFEVRRGTEAINPEKYLE